MQTRELIIRVPSSPARSQKRDVCVRPGASVARGKPQEPRWFNLEQGKRTADKSIFQPRGSRPALVGKWPSLKIMLCNLSETMELWRNNYPCSQPPSTSLALRRRRQARDQKQILDLHSRKSLDLKDRPRAPAW